MRRHSEGVISLSLPVQVVLQVDPTVWEDAEKGAGSGVTLAVAVTHGVRQLAGQSLVQVDS